MNNIITYKGYKSFNDIEVGDFLYDGVGGYKRVDTISCGKSSSTYKVKLNGIQDDIVLGGGKVLGYRGYKSDRSSSKLSWIDLDDLRVGDSVCYKLSNSKGYSSKDIDLATFLSYFVLYGFINMDKGKVVIHLDSSRGSMRKEILKSVKVVFPNACIDEYSYQGEDFISIIDSMAMMLCTRFGERFENRVLIEEIINSDLEFLKAFIKPLFEYNMGRDGNFFMPSSSYRLLLGYQRVLFRLKKFSNIYECDSKDKRFKYFALNMNRVEMNRTLEDSCWFIDDDYVFIKVDSVNINVGEEIKTYNFGNTSYCNGLLVIKSS